LTDVNIQKTNRYYLPPQTELSGILEDWLLLDDEVAVAWRPNTGGAEDGLTDPLDAMVLLSTGDV